MLVTTANPCGGIAGFFVCRHISVMTGLSNSRQRARMTELASLAISDDWNTLFTIPPAAAAVARASKPFRCGARRRVRDDGGEEDGDAESHGYNEEISMLELYSQSCREEALIVTATVDDEEVEVLIFKGYSSCLSGETAVDPARSVLPERAVIKEIDRVKGPFDPSQIHYIQKGLSFEAFKETMITLK